jgi:hypothetical protein
MDTKHKDFMKWIRSGGAQIEGVALKRVSGKGIGIFASRNIKVSEVTYYYWLTSRLFSKEKILFIFQLVSL